MPDEDVDDRRPEMARDLACLIEATLILTAPVERDRHDAFHVLHVGAFVRPAGAPATAGANT